MIKGKMEKKKNILGNIPMFITIGGFEIGDPPVDPSGYSNIDTVVDSKIVVGINYFIAFSAVVAVALIIMAGYNFITAAGDPEKIEKGQKGITAAIVGMVIVLLARTVVLYLLEKILVG